MIVAFTLDIIYPMVIKWFRARSPRRHHLWSETKSQFACHLNGVKNIRQFEVYK